MNGGSRGVAIFQEIPTLISEDKVLHRDSKTRFSAHLKPIKANLVAMDVLTNMLARIGCGFCTYACPDCDVDCGFAEITTCSGKMLPEAYWAPLKQKMVTILCLYSLQYSLQIAKMFAVSFQISWLPSLTLALKEA